MSDNASAIAAEAALLFEKTYECPVCKKEFKAKKVRSGRARLIGSDTDLRQKYQTVDCLKYDAVACPECGYASLDRFFNQVVPAEGQMIQEAITKNFYGLPDTGEIYTYEDALERYKLALKNCVAKRAADSERAYTCLKLAWICRGWVEVLEQEGGEDAERIATLKAQETKMIDSACTGFLAAYSKEEFPMCGMDELTFSYLLAELCRRTGRFEDAGRWISHVLVSREASDRIKNRAREVKELLNEDMKKAEAAEK